MGARSAGWSAALPLLLLASTCVGLACGGDGDGQRSTLPVSGNASVSTGGETGPVRVVAVGLDGAHLGEAAVSGGAFSLDVEGEAGQRVLLTAVLASNPERRAMALVDLAEPSGAVDGGLSAGKADNGASGPVTIDTDTTATALVAGASGSLEARLPDLRARYGGQIGTVRDGLDTLDFPLCSVSGSAASDTALDPMADALRSVSEDALPGEGAAVPQLIRDLLDEATADRPVLERLRNMQRNISHTVFSLNNPRLAGNADYVLGVMPSVILRVTIWATTSEETNGLSDAPLSRSQLNRLAGMIAGIKWGNCREKAYLAAFAASLMPDLKQVAVVGVVLDGGSAHALAVACLDGPEVWDLSTWGGPFGTDFATPPAVAGRCFAVDPWQGPEGEPTAGHTEVLDADSASRWGYDVVDIVKPVQLGAGAPEPRDVRVSSRVDCGLPGSTCSAFDGGEPAPPEPDAGPTEDVEDDVEECPPYEVVTPPCGGPAGCIEGFYCSTQTIACEQEECPEGAGRTFTLECCCNCWADKSLKNVHDPCRPGFLLRCEPADSREP